ncbi:MAG TPA: BTAD domain-containing putative transcriptional regulator [Actinoplanes sp.]|nr:BTAD domain-containing putative transcriptional regulator [Actinoplanes sp.]
MIGSGGDCGMDWRLLGPMRLRTAGGDVDLGPGKQRCLLAALLLSPGQVIPAGTLVDRIWDDEPPRSGTPLAPYATRLRRILDPVLGPGSLRFTAGGYLIDCAPDRIDLHRARRHVTAARATEDTGDHEGAAALLRTALDGWESEALAGVPGSWAARIRDSLARERLDVHTRLGRALLRTGRAEDAAGLLAPLAADHPTVESVAAALMRALVAAGRPAQALEAFARTRDAIAEQLGTGPGPELSLLHTRILRGDPFPSPSPSPASVPDPSPAAAPEARPGVPAQLPADAIAFTGRRDETADLDRLLTGERRIAAVTGPPGVGKSALAVHWGHRSRQHFPDGQLYLNLRGFDRADQVMTPDEAAYNLVTALAPGHPVPPGLDARTGLLRSLLDGRRVLLVLDNVRDAAHARPLLPGAGDSAVVVTSRDRLGGLVASHGAMPVPVAVLEAGPARELLAGRLGPVRLSAEPDPVATLVTATAGLPLALVTVAARAAMRAGQPLAELAGEIAGSRLGGLDGDDETDPRTVFSWSYRALSPAAARLFRLLGVNPGPDISMPAILSLSGAPHSARDEDHDEDRGEDHGEEDARAAGSVGAALAELVSASLVNEHRPGRYVMHDLLRAYAADLIEEPDRDPAVRRLLDHLLHTAWTASVLGNPRRPRPPRQDPAPGVRPEPLAGEPEALAWFTAELPNLMAAVRHAAEIDDYGWRLPAAMTGFLETQGHWHDWQTAATVAAAAAHRRGEDAAEATARVSLARRHTVVGRYGDADEQHAEAVRIYARIGDLRGQGQVLFGMARMRDEQGRLDESRELIHRARDLMRQAGDQVGEARALSALGWTEARDGRHDLALRYLHEALPLNRELNDRHGESATWDSIGMAHLSRGEHGEATAAFRRALDLFLESGDLGGQSESREHLGDAYAAAGDGTAAAEQWRQALELADRLGHPRADGLRVRLRSA